MFNPTPQPARIEVYRRDSGPRGLAADYDSVVVSEPGGVTARARVADEAGVVFKVQDLSMLDAAVVPVRCA